MEIIVDLLSSERISGWVRGTVEPQSLHMVFGDRVRNVRAGKPRPDLPAATAFTHIFDATERGWVSCGKELAIHVGAEYSPRLRLRLANTETAGVDQAAPKALDKPIAVIGTKGYIPQSWQYSSKELFASTGFNTGNLAFQYGVWHQIASPKEIVPFNFDPKHVAATCRMLCIPAANYLYHAFDFGEFATRLERCNLPIMVLGLGIQAQNSVKEVVLHPGTERLLHLFSERCQTIAVRGNYTAQVLNDRGIHNFFVLGCPSNFINPDPNLGRRIATRLPYPRRRFAYAPTFYPQNSQIEGLIAAELGDRLSEIVCQEPLPAIALARGDREADLDAWLSGDSGFLAMMNSEVRAALADRLRCYFSIDDWLAGYRRFDAILGLRIHGAALGWQAGRAACVVSHDLRTEELARAMGLPLLRSADVQQGRLLAQFEKAVADAASSYDQRRAELAKQYCNLLMSHGVEPSPTLSWLTTDET